MSSYFCIIPLLDKHLIFLWQGCLYLSLCVQRSEDIKNCQAMPVKAVLMHFEQMYELAAAKLKGYSFNTS